MVSPPDLIVNGWVLLCFTTKNPSPVNDTTLLVTPKADEIRSVEPELRKTSVPSGSESCFLMPFGTEISVYDMGFTGTRRDLPNHTMPTPTSNTAAICSQRTGK